MLGYRTLFDVDDPEDGVLDLAVRAFRAWIKAKRNPYNGDSLEFDEPARLGPDARALLIGQSAQDGSRWVRATLWETNEAGAWTTQLTAMRPRTGHAWVWVDVDGPSARSDGSGQRQWVSTPTLVRRLVEEVPAHDGPMSLHNRAARAFPLDVDRIIDIVCDVDRRVPVFIAATAPGVAFAPWLDQVTAVLRETVGIAGAYVLDAEATVSFAEQIGDTHAVPVGTVRSFLAAADPASRVDARRHRILGATQLAQVDHRRLSRMLGWWARDNAIAQPLPRAVVRLDERLEAYTNDLLVERARVQRDTQMPDTAAIETHLSDTSAGGRGEGPAEQREPARLLALPLSVVDWVNAQPVDGADAADKVMRLALMGAQVLGTANAAIDLEERLTQVTAEREQARSEARVAAAQRDDQEVETAEALDEKQDLSERVRTLTERVKQLATALYADGRAEAVTTPGLSSPSVRWPQDMQDLLLRLSELPFIVFTGDEGKTLELMEPDPMGNWASKAWQALLAASDYARLKAGGEFSGSMHTFLMNPPDGCSGFSQHAATESEAVQDNPAFRRAREFPVPIAIDPRGRAFMGAHFKVAKFRLISPRMHYLDATGADGKIYVGYLGRHLPNDSTN